MIHYHPSNLAKLPVEIEKLCCQPDFNASKPRRTLDEVLGKEQILARKIDTSAISRAHVASARAVF